MIGDRPGSPALRRRPGEELRVIAAVFAKEVLETIRDRRTVIVALLLPVVMMPIVTLGIPFLSQRQQREREEAPAVVAVVNGRAARELVGLGVRRRLIAVAGAADPRRALLDGEVDAVLRVPSDFSARLARGPVQITVLYDEGRAESVLARQRLQETVALFNAGLTEPRLRARGLSRADLTPVRLSAENVADERRLGAVLLAGLLPFFISVWAVLGGQYAALDLGAGEKERRTLEALLVTPPSRWQLVAGKFLAVTAASSVAVFMVIATTLATLRLGAGWGISELERAAVVISAGPAVLMLLVAFALVSFLSALQLALSIYARGIREAQQYFTPVYLLLSLPAMAAPFLEGWAEVWWTYLAPGLNAVFVFRQILLGGESWIALGLTLVTTAAATALALAAAVRLLRTEAAAARG
ncbi:MAG: ABC transporter permease subunit [Armatimonadota bacterium]|nr:ABC transporter permease subunit [Armatimonadota bacterium]MDR7451759.1 ABC transporter permease subunit [Armatimonadota bacterium]MDR7467384.1 ABC transporter permease subunit [Armatimonadota bacterium]MDR7494154.1 ABC transporter permease subunit [Armatimonadota bacterium]MDR7498880.1 ABC transporter permease subunit [Armatimonadota bacterium]